MSAVVFLLVPGLYRIFVELAKCGDFVTGFDDGTVRGKCFSVAKMLIDTRIRHFIKGWINLSLGEGCCGVFVKESGNVAAGCLGYQSSFVKTTEDALFDCPTIPSTMGLSEGRKLEGRHVLVAESQVLLAETIKRLVRLPATSWDVKIIMTREQVAVIY